MIKVPGSDKPYRGFHGSPLLDDSFDPTRDDWSRHEEGTRQSNDGLGYDRDDPPSWFAEDEEGHELPIKDDTAYPYP